MPGVKDSIFRAMALFLTIDKQVGKPFEDSLVPVHGQGQSAQVCDNCIKETRNLSGSGPAIR